MTAANIGRAFKHPSENYIGIENKGTSKLASDGGFAALLVVGWGMNHVEQYGWALHTWTSSSYSHYDGDSSATQIHFIQKQVMQALIYLIDGKL